MHAAFTRPGNHGISMMVVAKFMRLIGIDQLHIGTIVGKMSEEEHDVIKSKEVLTLNKMPETTYIKDQEWGKIKPVFPVASGGLHPGHVAKLMEYFGKDVIIQMGGGIHGNPLGTVKGAMAARQAVDATLEGISLIDYAKKHPELQAAIDKFGVLK
jgi:ribulose-bisphosphate carboxylase large chain